MKQWNGIRAKVLLGAGSLLLPVMVLLYFNLDQISFDIRFAEKERIGNRLQRSLVELLASEVRPGAVTAALASLGARKSDADLLGVNSSAIEAATGRFAQGEESARDPWRQAVRAAIALAGDASNLTLDPEMDSYYLADVTSVVTAQSLERWNRIHQTLLKTNLSQEDRIGLERLIGLAEESDRSRLEGDLATAIAENAKSPRGASPSLQRDLKPVIEAYLTASRNWLDLASQTARGKSLPRDRWMAAADQARQSLLALHLHAAAELDKLLVSRAEGYEKYRRNIWLGLLISLSLAALLLVRIVNGIVRPLSEVVDQLDRIACRDLTHQISAEHLGREDEIGKLARSSKSMSDSLIEVILQLRNNADALRKTSSSLGVRAGEMQAGVEDTSQRAQTSAVAAEQMSMNVQTIASSMEQTTTNLGHVASAATSISSTISEINSSTDDARRTTLEAEQQAAEILNQMKQLTDAAQAIGQVTETIRAISSQTNLLALNASIEAARAGSAGKGFAVVAQEIKDLAQQSAASTDDIRQRIEAVQASTQAGMNGMERIFEVVNGVKDQVGSIAEAIGRQSTTVSGISNHIAEAAIGAKEVNLRVGESATVALEMARESAGVNDVARRLAHGSAEVSDEAKGLDEMASRLIATVELFAVPAR